MVINNKRNTKTMNKSKSWILLMFCFLLTVSAYGQTRKPVRKSVTRTARVAKPVRKVTSTSTKTTATTVAPVMEKDVWTGKREVTIPGSVGKLAATLQVPEMKQGAKVPLVILMHGLGSDKDNMLFAALADSLQENGIASLRFDFNSHGKSEGNIVDMDFNNLQADAEKVLNYARKLDFVSSISLAGHSMGGVIASMVAGREGTNKIKSVVLFAPAVAIQDDAQRGEFSGFKFDPNNIPATFEVMGHTMGGKWLKTAQTLNILETAKGYQGKLYVIHGTEDQFEPYVTSSLYLRDNPNGKIVLLKGFDHYFSQDVLLPVSVATKYFREVLLGHSSK
jgi:hydrolase of alpha-beta family